MDEAVPLKGYDGYFVTKSGIVFSNKRGKHKPRKPHLVRGYVRVNLRVDGTISHRLVHRLVAMTFIPNPDNKPEVNHKDGDKLNNNVSNLEWSTRSHNLTHSYRVLNTKPPMSKSVKCLETGKIYSSGRVAGLNVGVDGSNVLKAARGVQKTAGGFHWEFYDG